MISLSTLFTTAHATGSLRSLVYAFNHRIDTISSRSRVHQYGPHTETRSSLRSSANPRSLTPWADPCCGLLLLPWLSHSYGQTLIVFLLNKTFSVCFLFVSLLSTLLSVSKTYSLFLTHFTMMSPTPKCKLFIQTQTKSTISSLEKKYQQMWKYYTKKTYKPFSTNLLFYQNRSNNLKRNYFCC